MGDGMGHKTKAQRRAEAAERNTAWSGLSDAEKLATLDERPGQSARQSGGVVVMGRDGQGPAAANIKGEHVPCEQTAPHVGWAHSNREHEMIWHGVGESTASARWRPGTVRGSSS